MRRGLCSSATVSKSGAAAPLQRLTPDTAATATLAVLPPGGAGTASGIVKRAVPQASLNSLLHAKAASAKPAAAFRRLMSQWGTALSRARDRFAKPVTAELERFLAAGN